MSFLRMSALRVRFRWAGFVAHLSFAFYHAFVALSFDDMELTHSETFLYVWAFARFCDESAKIAEWTLHGLRVYCRSGWNVMDIVVILLYTSSVTLRSSGVSYAPDPLDGRLATARIIFALLSVLNFLSLLQRLKCFKLLGILTIVLQHMVQDVINFAIILMIIASGFAVAFGTLLHHTNSEIEGEEWYRKPLGEAPLWSAYWAVFGGLGIRYFSWSDGESDPEYAIRALAFFIGVFLFIVLIQTRLLVAMRAGSH